MQPLELNIAFRRCRRKLQCSKKRILLIDYDGTIAPFHLKPESARPYPDVCRIIESIQNDPATRVVIVTGRWIRDLIPLLPFQKLPEIWGLHGGERLKTNGEHTFGKIDRASLRALLATDDWSEEMLAHGARCERKPGSVAIHWRGLPQDAVMEIRTKAVEHWTACARACGLSLLEFDGGIEFRTWEHHKGFAVATVLGEYGKNAAAVYIGDDITDEDAFKAVKGRGCGVLVAEKPRPTEAEFRIQPYKGLLNFLSKWKEMCGGEDGGLIGT